MKKKKFRMGPCATTFQWFCLVFLLIMIFWDSDITYFINQHIIIVGIFIGLLAIVCNVTDFYLRIKNDEKKKKEKSNEKSTKQ